MAIKYRRMKGGELGELPSSVVSGMLIDTKKLLDRLLELEQVLYDDSTLDDMVISLSVNVFESENLWVSSSPLKQAAIAPRMEPGLTSVLDKVLRLLDLIKEKGENLLLYTSRDDNKVEFLKGLVTAAINYLLIFIDKAVGVEDIYESIERGSDIYLIYEVKDVFPNVAKYITGTARLLKDRDPRLSVLARKEEELIEFIKNQEDPQEAADILVEYAEDMTSEQINSLITGKVSIRDIETFFE